MARQMVKKLLDGPLLFTAKDGYFEFEGVGTLAEIMASDGVATMVASPSIPSWNQLLTWLREMQALRESSGNAA
jgi:hypothetical protein